MGEKTFTQEDLSQIRERGMTPHEVLAQLEQLKRGFPFFLLDRACTVGDGINAFGQEETQRMAEIYTAAALSGRAMKFVPASGAASRMFKSLLSTENRFAEMNDSHPDATMLEQDPDGRASLRFLKEIHRFAICNDLKAVMARNGLDLEKELSDGRYRVILEYVLTRKGLNLSEFPKGLIPFHVYPLHARTAFEEHLAEAILYISDLAGRARIHFTVSPEHKTMVSDSIEQVRLRYERGNTRFEISYSTQEPRTDTVAAERNDAPFRDASGRLVFRPGGHGALLDNLNGLNGDIVFIKNIDNVLPDRLKRETVLYKKALGGYLVVLQEKIFSYLERLKADEGDQDLVREGLEFLRSRLSVFPPEALSRASIPETRVFLLDRLNRPLRVCGMVKNEGEPGGGPFWVRFPDGSLSLQIVESSQVDMNRVSQKDIWDSATHFNPVDLVCGVRDYRGDPFDLMRFRDPETGFVSIKSKDGRELKALELPGLWNGSMAFWNTAFVEVPISTFSPVKTVLDLLRPEHLADGECEARHGTC